MTDPTISDSYSHPTAEELSLFLSRYCARLLGAGATCIRLEKNATRIARAYGMELELTIMPRHIHLSIWRDGHTGATTAIATMRHCATSFDINTRLSRLSWEIADGKLDFHSASRQLDCIGKISTHPTWATLILVTIANAAFCRLFGGDLAAMIIAGIATAVGFHIKTCLLNRNVDTRAAFIACSFVSTILGATDTLFSIGDTPAITIGTSVLYLVPGIPLLNSFSDLLYRHYLCAISRAADATILTGCLSIGLCAGMSLMGIGMF